MWKTSVSPRRTGLANPQAGVENWVLVHRVTIQPVSADLSTGRFLLFHVDMWKKIRGRKMPAWGSKRGVDVGCDIPDSGLQGGRGVLQAHFHLADGVNDGGVISSKFPSDFREGEIGQLADQIHGNLPCLCRAFIFEGAAQDGFVNGIEPANLADESR